MRSASSMLGRTWPFRILPSQDGAIPSVRAIIVRFNSGKDGDFWPRVPAWRRGASADTSGEPLFIRYEGSHIVRYKSRNNYTPATETNGNYIHEYSRSMIFLPAETRKARKSFCCDS